MGTGGVRPAQSLAQRLAEAQSKAALLFRAIEDERLVRAGQSEEQISAAIFALAGARFGVERYWHRRVVRSGPHTRLPFRETPPDRVVEDDDIVSLDLGLVFDADEADFGRTYVIGDDPEKHRLRADLAQIFDACRAHYSANPAMSGRGLYAHVLALSRARGWEFGGAHAGHLIGEFPFPREERYAARNWIRPDNDEPMDAPRGDGGARYWILEVHLLDPTGEFGGFYEELLTGSR